MENQTPRHTSTISRILFGGTARMVVRAALQNRVENCISPALFDERRVCSSYNAQFLMVA
jgi:hypothetical protein